MGFFADSKDRLMETMALPVLNRTFLEPYGRATSLRIDSTGKTAEVTLELKGEQEPLRIEINGYELREEGRDTFIIIRGMATSREWLSKLAQRFVIDRPLRLPPQVAGTLTKFL